MYVEGVSNNAVDAVGRIEVVPSILETLCALTGMGFAAVARVTEDRWIACSVRDGIAFGLEPGGELPIETTICHEIRDSGDGVVIDDVATDPLYATHHTPALYGLRSYISMPIRLPDGSFFGTLCAIDPRPAHVSRPEVVQTFRMFADLIGFHLEGMRKLAASEESLLDATKVAELREQFIAVLGHDLRNPLGSIQAGIALLAKPQTAIAAETILGMMGRSVDRMNALIGDILDFARGRLGGGLGLERRPVEMPRLIEQVIAELSASHPGATIIGDCRASLAVDCDPYRVSQLLSNLLGNAITHGASDQPIGVACAIEDGVFALAVSNGGNEIPVGARMQLFQPFARGSAAAGREGLGLGLYIAAEIAAAHGGTLGVDSSPDRTTFTFAMPV